MWAEKINEIALEVINEKVVEALSRINSSLPVAEWRSNGRIEMVENGVSLFWDNELLVFFDYGTGDAAKAYLSKYSENIRKDAMLFKKPTDGNTDEHNNILPAIFNAEKEINDEINKRVEEWFKGVKL